MAAEKEAGTTDADAARSEGPRKIYIGAAGRTRPRDAAEHAEARFGEEVGERLRRIREVLGLSLSDVASGLTISRQTLGNYESGRTPQRASVIRELAEIYDVSCDWLLGMQDQIEVRASFNGRETYLRETSPRIYPASVVTDDDRRKWDEARERRLAQSGETGR